ncbi:LysR family transcriptional regulator [Photobacterium rosenbergii]|uniref:LysR family transcriptional regulator n=1 Tax=Photobacterium rosenbergii TaxID=294936 RepID=UPI001C998218|nr:LysR family transcriptional regulator [Photobacterium rosenbergii]MBY5944713.1 LysR family transcriptional regulator [Photobacterium rosenbergii]
MKALPTQLPIFIQVAKTGSFAKAARALGISAPAVSKAIGKLEEEWQVKLFHRSSHSLSLTQMGEQLFDSLTPSVESIQNTIERITDDSQSLSGKLKINLPSSSIGQEHILPLILDFMEAYPEITCDLHFDDRVVDLVEHGFDLGIGTAINQDSRLIARRLFEVGIGVYATPDYLTRYGKPTTIKALDEHKCIPVRSTTSGRFHGWRLNDGEGNKLYEPKGKLIVNHFRAAKQATLASAGISCLGSWMFKQELEQNQVVPLLESYWGEPIQVWVYYSSREYLPTRVRTLIDYLVSNIDKVL